MTSQYRSPVDDIGEGIEACWLNALDLLESAKLVKSQGHHALALSLAVLTMEEIGKMIMIDGLLFAKPGDERSKIFEGGFRCHKSKLGALDVFPFLLRYLGTLDPRYSTEQRFNLTLAIVLQQYKKERQALEPWLGPACDLRDLDSWKQRGFYTHVDSNGHFVHPAEIIDEDFSAAVVGLANRLGDAVNFILKDNMTRYKERIHSLREKLTEEQLFEIRKHAQDLVKAMFTVTENESEQQDGV